MTGLILAVAALLLAATPAANFPSGSYVYTGGVKDFRNRLVTSGDGAELRVVRTNGTVLAACAVTDPTCAGVNFRLEVPLSVRATDVTASAGEPMNVALSHGGEVSAMAPLPPVGEGFGSTNLLLQVVAMTSFTNAVTGAVVQVPDDYLRLLAVFLEENGYKTYDPFADWDGDGLSNYDEYLGGTNPFDKSEGLRIRSFAPAGDGAYAVTFEYAGGRVYSLSATRELSRPRWADRGFRPESRTAAEQDRVAYPDTPDGDPGLATLYLTPVSPTNEFFRINLK